MPQWASTKVNIWTQAVRLQNLHFLSLPKAVFFILASIISPSHYVSSFLVSLDYVPPLIHGFCGLPTPHPQPVFVCSLGELPTA